MEKRTRIKELEDMLIALINTKRSLGDIEATVKGFRKMMDILRAYNNACFANNFTHVLDLTYYENNQYTIGSELGTMAGNEPFYILEEMEKIKRVLEEELIELGYAFDDEYDFSR